MSEKPLSSVDVMVGDSLTRDVHGALAAGLDAVWLTRSGTHADTPEATAPRITTLAELQQALASRTDASKPDRPSLTAASRRPPVDPANRVPNGVPTSADSTAPAAQSHTRVGATARTSREMTSHDLRAS